MSGCRGGDCDDSKNSEGLKKMKVKIMIFLVLALMPSFNVNAQTILKEEAIPTWQEWGELIDESENTITIIEMLSPTYGWAGGYGGLLAFWNGVTWIQVPSPVTTRILDIAIISESDAWAVSADSILRWNGYYWVVHSYLPGVDFLTSISMVSATDGWVVGINYGFDGYIVDAPFIHWDGSQWTNYSYSLDIALNSVKMLSSSSGWAVGRAGAIVYYDGIKWSRITSPVTKTLNSVDFLSFNNGWIGGDGVILRWNGASWVVYGYYSSLNIIDIEITDIQEAWALDNDLILKWSGDKWSTNYSTDLLLRSLSMVNSEYGWAAAGSKLLNYRLPTHNLFLPILIK